MNTLKELIKTGVMNENKTLEDVHDSVNQPRHYTQGEIESIQAIESMLGQNGIRACCRASALQYIWRAPDKGKVEDLKKAVWYLNYAIGTYGGKK